MTRRPRLLAALGVLVAMGVLAGLLVGGIIGPNAKSPGASSDSPGSATGTTSPTPTPTPRRAPGHEVFGFVPYWEMDERIAAHLARTDLTTLALFSVTNKRTGALDTAGKGYLKITGPLGQRLIREAHDRGTRVELVFSSFGTAKNKRLFGSQKIQDAVIADLVALVRQTGTDGVNVDVEQLDGSLVQAYGAFVGRLRAALRAAEPKAQVSVATPANANGAAMAVAATAAEADRIFLMGYDFHWSGSAPGASSPIDRRDGNEKDLIWALDLYEALGVPVERTILGLPLYGMAWPVRGPEVAAPQTGKGKAWIPSDNLDILGDATLVPVLDDIEQVEVYTLPVDKNGKPTAVASPAASPAGWLAIYVDSPATLTPKIRLANERGLAGIGFWAIGYEQGLPDYTELISSFRAGKLD
jgi:spore germination protein YaaH